MLEQSQDPKTRNQEQGGGCKQIVWRVEGEAMRAFLFLSLVGIKSYILCFSITTTT